MNIEKNYIEWQPFKGISQSPLSDNALMQCCDNETHPGVVRINFASQNRPTAAYTFDSRAVKIEDNKMFTSSGDFWYYENGVWTREQSGNGSGYTFVKWKDYYITFYNTSALTYEVDDLSSADPIATGRVQDAYVSKDDILYMVDENIVLTLTEVAGQTFNPNDTGTYTLNTNALDLPVGESIKAISEIGSYMAFGTESGKIYVWDRNFVTFENQIDLGKPIRMLINGGNLLYALTSDGSIYVTDTTSSRLVFSFPKYILSNPDQDDFIFYPHAFRLEDNKLFVGFGSTSAVSPMGIFSYNLDTKDFKLDYLPSNGAFGQDSDNKCQITAIQEKGNFHFGITKTTSSTTIYSMDFIPQNDSGEDRYGSFKSIIYSSLARVGSKRSKSNFKSWEIQLSEELPVGCSVRLSYRRSKDDSWNILTNFNTAGELSHIFDKTISDFEYIQLRVELNSTDEKTPNLSSIILWR